MQPRGPGAWNLLAAALIAGGCGGDGGTGVEVPPLRVTVATTGPALDPNGYRLLVDGIDRQRMGVNATVDVTGVAPGSHAIGLSDLAANCAVQGENPRSVSVVVGKTARIGFTVTCSAPAPNTGTLRITTVTSGANVDPDGYLLEIDGGANQPIGLNSIIDLANFTAGPHTVLLSGLAANCHLEGDNPQNVTVTAAATAEAAFAITCGQSAGKIAFTSDRDGNSEIYVMNADGSDVTRLTNDPAIDRNPAWSPDGSKIAFTSDRGGTSEIYTMNADGSGVTQVTSGIGGADPAWVPDGSKIAFEGVPPLITGAVAVGPRMTTSTWRRSEERAATPYVGFSNYEIYVINPDGSEQTRLTFNPFFDLRPAWSPDGSKIAFTSSDDIWIMNADGSDPTALTVDPAVDDDGAWSPDGSKIAFSSTRDGPIDIYIMNADGSDVTRLTNPHVNEKPAWSPDGSKIVFERSGDDHADFEIYVMSADGSDVTRLTTNPAFDGEPAWSR